eukprot:TRINITY_DN19644_c0_g1_i1.p1 TRINITY_DN19644_c0_g1~~TRINITY_DN19644_c0_g1_i1.p1  ORF type:complete len:209 (-),score=28.93 TRINITY_DN19644_c0_g1_i1:208-834(-)
MQNGPSPSMLTLSDVVAPPKYQPASKGHHAIAIISSIMIGIGTVLVWLGVFLPGDMLRGALFLFGLVPFGVFCGIACLLTLSCSLMDHLTRRLVVVAIVVDILMLIVDTITLGYMVLAIAGSLFYDCVAISLRGHSMPYDKLGCIAFNLCLCGIASIFLGQIGLLVSSSLQMKRVPKQQPQVIYVVSNPIGPTSPYGKWNMMQSPLIV